MELFVFLDGWVEEITISSLQNAIDILGIGTDIESPILQSTLRELLLLVAVHNHDILCPHLWRVGSVIGNIAMSPERFPRIRGNLCCFAICCTPRCAHLEIIEMRKWDILDNHIREVVHIYDKVHHSMNCKAYHCIVVILAIADNLQCLLDLNISVVFILCSRLQRSIKVEFVPTSRFEMAAILTMPSEVV